MVIVIRTFDRDKAPVFERDANDLLPDVPPRLSLGQYNGIVGDPEGLNVRSRRQRQTRSPALQILSAARSLRKDDDMNAAIEIILRLGKSYPWCF